MNKSELVKLLKVVPKNGFDIIFHDRRESKLFFTTDRPLTMPQKEAARVLRVQVTLAAMPSYYKKGYRYGAKLLDGGKFDGTKVVGHDQDRDRDEKLRTSEPSKDSGL